MTLFYFRRLPGPSSSRGGRGHIDAETGEGGGREVIEVSADILVRL